jgi:hypothetical protein
MKRLITSLVFLFMITALGGCYTIPKHFADDYDSEQVIIYYEVPPPPPIIDYYPPIPPTPPVTNPPDPNPKPIIRQPNPPNNSGNSGNQVRDPLLGHGERGNTERNTQGRK